MMDPEMGRIGVETLDTIMEDESASQHILKSKDEEEKSWWPGNFEQHQHLHPKAPSSVASTTDGVIDAHKPTTLQQINILSKNKKYQKKSPIVANFFQPSPKRSENLGGKSPSLIAVVGSRSSRRENRNCFVNNGVRNPQDGSFPSNNEDDTMRQKSYLERCGFKMWTVVVFFFAFVATGVGLTVWKTGGDSKSDNSKSIPTSNPSVGDSMGMGMVDDLFPTDSPTITRQPSLSPSQPPNSSLSWLLERENQIRLHLTKNYDHLHGQASTTDEEEKEEIDDEKYLFLIKGTPQYQAYQWILQEDKTLQLSSSENEVQWKKRLNQRYVLALLYYSNGGDHWLQSEKFLIPDTHECSWVGVDCISITEPYIMSIRFDGMNLTGTFPTSEFFYMLSDTLEIAALDNNSLNGFFADMDELDEDTICIAQKLRWLNLGNNDLKESLAKKIWSQMPHLTHFYLHQNQLMGTIPEFELSDNATYIPIQALWLQENNLTGPLPESIETWSDLEQLRLHKNQINSSIPTGLWNLPELVHLHLSDNQLTGLIFSSTNEKMGEDYNKDTANNTESTSTSSSSSAIMSLSENIADGNSISEEDKNSIFLPMNNSKLETLWLSNNLFSGSLPPLLPPSIETVWLEHNQLTGTIPWEDLSHCVNLTSIRLHGNQISGGTLGCDTMVQNDNKIDHNETEFDLTTSATTISLENSRNPIKMDEDGVGYFTADCTSSSKVKCTCCQCF